MSGSNGDSGGFVVLGTDTDAGKTTFSLLWMAAFGEDFAYWKPLETGASDTETIRRLVPGATTCPPLAYYQEPVAPPLAAQRAGRPIPDVAEIVAARPGSPKPLLIETFGSPLSPLSDDILQVELVRALGLPTLLVASSAVGAVGRTLQSLAALREAGVRPAAVVLMGPHDPYAADQIGRHGGGIPVSSLQPPETWDAEGIHRAASGQAEALSAIRPLLTPEPAADAGADLIARDRKAVWHPYTSLQDPTDPLPVVRAEGEFLHLADGRRLIDGVSSWWTTLHGHRHPPLMKALREAAAKFDHVMFAGITHEPAVELAELLLETGPHPDGRVFFSDNGSTAVEVALKLAYQSWRHRGEAQRTLFVGFEGGYHGDTFGAMAVGRDPLFFGPFEPLLFRALQIPVASEALDAALSRHPGEVAAVIIEPLVQGAGGMLMHSPETLRALFEVARKHGVPFIVDEVMTGGGRTGTLWAHQQAGIAPDLLCSSKTLTGGMMPLSATIASPEVVSAFDTDDRTRTFFHGHSYTAHPLACAVAAANWKLLREGHWQKEAARIERTWRESLARLAEHPAVREVRIRGTIAAIDLDLPGGYLAAVGKRLRDASIERGVLLRPLGQVLYAMPPLCTSDRSLAAIVGAIEHAVAGVQASG